MANNNSNSSPLKGWLLPIFALMIFPPFGILLIVVKLLSSTSRTRPQQGRHPYYTQFSQSQSGPIGARTTASPSFEAQTSQTQNRVDKTSIFRDMERSGKRLIIIGAVLAILPLMSSTLEDFIWSLSWLFRGDFDLFWFDLSEALPMLIMSGGGFGCLWAGLRRRKQAKNFRRYLNLIGNQTVLPLSSIASAMGRPIAKVREDLADMLDAGLLPVGYLDFGMDQLVLSDKGLTSQPKPKKESQPKAEKEAPKPKSPTQEESDILGEIKAVNDAIANEKMSQQIDRIGVITSKILDYQKSHPAKASQLRTFLSYYLPATLRILRAYAQLESQGVDGENIRSAMERIENMMSKVVEGFEKQLDQLFQGDVLDLTADVQVLEQMLAKDGLSIQDENIQLEL